MRKEVSARDSMEAPLRAGGARHRRDRGIRRGRRRRFPLVL